MSRRIKDVRQWKHDTYIEKQYITEYSINSYNRYKHSNRFLLADKKLIRGNLNPWDTLIINQTVGSTYTVTLSDENRIDIIATKVYGSASLYWIICYANSIADPLTIPAGTKLRIPNLADLFTYPNPLA